jgi:hypothetical protein
MSAHAGNFYALLTLIVAPAVLTNASSVLALNTANRFGRVVDRVRQLVQEIECDPTDTGLHGVRLRQVARLRRRAAMLLHAQTCLYAAVGLFVATALLSIFGGSMAQGHPGEYRLAGVGGMVVGTAAAVSLVAACFLLVNETRLAVVTLSEEAALLDARVRPFGLGDELVRER